MSKLKNRILTAIFVLFIFSFAVLLAVLPKKERSENEKRVLASFPEITVNSISNGEFALELETYLSDHFPFREKFVGLDAYMGLLLGQNGENGIYFGKDGYLITEPPEFEMSRAEKNAGYIENFVSETNLPSSVIIVPSTGFVYSEKLPKNHKVYRDDEIIDTVRGNTKSTSFIDLRNCFNDNKNRIQIYYKTDHHLTSQGSMLVYNEFCREKKITPANFTLQEKIEKFFGTCYSKSGFWGTKGDTVELYKTETSYTVTINDGKNIKTNNSLYFYEHLDNLDKYPVFLDGNHALVKIKNKQVNNGKKLLIVKDSYAHCFTTFLAENYEEIIMVDLRYYKKSVKELASEEEFSELLFMFGSENISTSTDFAWLLM